MNDTSIERSPQAHARWPWILAGLTALIGLAITMYAWSRITAREEAAALQRFRLEAETIRLNTERELNLFMEVLNSIRALHGLSGEIRPEALQEFVEKGMVHQQQILGTFGFSQRISHTLRRALEDAHAEADAQGYRIVQQGPDRTWVPADEKPVYFPLTWQQEPDALGAPTGFDFASRPAARQAIERMQRSGKMAMVLEPAVPGDTDTRRHWVFSPIFYQPGEEAAPRRSSVMIGFAVGLLSPEEILDRVAMLIVPSPGLHLDLAPVTGEAHAAETVERNQDEWRYEHPIMVVDSMWRFQCRMPVSIAGRRSGAVLIAGLLITALMTSQLVLIAGRTRRIEEEVRTRTDELRRAKSALEEQMQERIRLEDEMTDLAARERQKVGRDLHDSVGQKLTGAVFLSRSLLSHFRESDHAEATHAQTLNETLKEAVGQVRAIARGLAPITLSDENLGEALAQLADEMTDLYGVSCDVGELDDGVRVNAKVKEQFYLIAREAVNNAARHAAPGRIVITLARVDAGVELMVTDDGKGIPSEAVDRPGMGLRIMRHRARMIGAALRIEPRASGGTCVACRLKPESGGKSYP